MRTRLGGIVVLRTVVIWFLLVVLAILNGAARVPPGAPTGSGGGACRKHNPSLRPHRGGRLFSVPWIAPPTARAALSAGALWLAMTLAFEFLAGHFLFGKPWPVLVADYNLLRGRVWIFVPLVTLLAPLWAWRLRIR